MILVDGQPASMIDVADRGLAYGDGLFETMRIERGNILRWRKHLQRLLDGCQRLQISLEPQLLQSEVQAFAARHVSGVAKLIITRGSGTRGYAFSQQQSARRILQYSPLPVWPERNFAQGVHLFACQTRLATQPLLAGLKHLNRLEQVLARAEWQDERYAEGLMLDLDGNVTDGVFSNLFFVRDGVLHTPLLDLAGVAGVMRASIIELAAQLGIQVQQRRIASAELVNMSEAFCCNSLYGIWPVLSVGQINWSAGPISLRLQQKIAQQDS